MFTLPIELALARKIAYLKIFVALVPWTAILSAQSFPSVGSLMVCMLCKCGLPMAPVCSTAANHLNLNPPTCVFILAASLTRETGACRTCDDCYGIIITMVWPSTRCTLAHPLMHVQAETLESLTHARNANSAMKQQAALAAQRSAALRAADPAAAAIHASGELA